MTPVRVLIIEDSDDDALLVITHLRRGGIEVAYERVQTIEAVSEALTARPPGHRDLRLQPAGVQRGGSTEGAAGQRPGRVVHPCLRSSGRGDRRRGHEGRSP